jgi:hypothetical protein
MAYNKITKEDTVDVINEKLQTEEYSSYDNAQIAHMLVELGCNVDFGIFRVENKQLVRR